jgi:hypothetical protein
MPEIANEAEKAGENNYIGIVPVEKRLYFKTFGICHILSN